MWGVEPAAKFQVFFSGRRRSWIVIKGKDIPIGTLGTKLYGKAVTVHIMRTLLIVEQAATAPTGLVVQSFDPMALKGTLSLPKEGIILV